MIKWNLHDTSIVIQIKLVQCLFIKDVNYLLLLEKIENKLNFEALKEFLINQKIKTVKPTLKIRKMTPSKMLVNWIKNRKKKLKKIAIKKVHFIRNT